MAAVPSIGRAQGIEGAPAAPEADQTRALYEQYAAQIFRYCLHQLGSREEAEDAVQSTFLNAFRGMKRGVVPELEAAWLFKIAQNVCLSRRRSSWRRGRIESPADFDVVEELAPAPSRRADELIGLQEVLEQMPEQQRRAILLREWQGLSYREIADELEVSQAAVETLIFRARRTLAQGLEQPPASLRRTRVRRHGGAVANLLSSAQSFLFGGGAAVKVAATVAAVGAGAVVATAPVQRHGPTGHTQPTPFAEPHTPATQAPAAAARPVRATVPPAAPARVATVTVSHRHASPARPAAAHAASKHAPPAHATAPSVATPPPAADDMPSAATPAPSPRRASVPAKGRETAGGQAKKDNRQPPAARAYSAGGGTARGRARSGHDGAPGRRKEVGRPVVAVAPTAIVATPRDPLAGAPGSHGNGKKDK